MLLGSYGGKEKIKDHHSKVCPKYLESTTNLIPLLNRIQNYFPTKDVPQKTAKKNYRYVMQFETRHRIIEIFFLHSIFANMLSDKGIVYLSKEDQRS